MSKRFRNNARTDDERKHVVESFVCLCPQCGGNETHTNVFFREGAAIVERLEIECTHCGRNTVRYKTDEDLYTVEGTGAPYFPKADNISATRYHSFDPSSYEREEDAIRAEVGLLFDCVLTYDLAGRHERAREMDERRGDLYLRAVEIGMDGFIPEAVFEIVLRAGINRNLCEGDSADRCLELTRGADLETKCRTYNKCMSLLMGQRMLSKFTDTLRDDIIAEANGLDSDDDGYVSAVLTVYRNLRNFCHDEAFGILDRAVRHFRNVSDVEVRETSLIRLYTHHITGIGDGPEMDEEIGLLDRYRDTYPQNYIPAVVRYGDMNVKHPGKRDGILLMTLRAMELLSGDIELEDPQSDNMYYFAELHWLLYRLEGNVDDLTYAMEYGIASVCPSMAFRFKEIERECYGHPDIPKATKARLRRKVKESIWSEIAPDR